MPAVEGSSGMEESRPSEPRVLLALKMKVAGLEVSLPVLWTRGVSPSHSAGGVQRGAGRTAKDARLESASSSARDSLAPGTSEEELRRRAEAEARLAASVSASAKEALARSGEPLTSATCRRWLKARGPEVERALEALEAHATWRAELVRMVAREGVDAAWIEAVYGPQGDARGGSLGAFSSSDASSSAETLAGAAPLTFPALSAVPPSPKSPVLSLVSSQSSPAALSSLLADGSLLEAAPALPPPAPHRPAPCPSRTLLSSAVFLPGFAADGSVAVLLEARGLVACASNARSPAATEALVRVVCFAVDAACLLADRAAPGARLTVLVDLAGVKARDLDALRRALTGVLAALSAHFPERLGRLAVLSAPLLFHGAWRAMRALLDPVTRDKVLILGARERADALVGADVLRAARAPAASGSGRAASLAALLEDAVRPPAALAATIARLRASAQEAVAGGGRASGVETLGMGEGRDVDGMSAPQAALLSRLQALPGAEEAARMCADEAARMCADEAARASTERAGSFRSSEPFQSSASCSSSLPSAFANSFSLLSLPASSPASSAATGFNLQTLARQTSSIVQGLASSLARRQSSLASAPSSPAAPRTPPATPGGGSHALAGASPSPTRRLRLRLASRWQRPVRFLVSRPASLHARARGVARAASPERAGRASGTVVQSKQLLRALRVTKLLIPALLVVLAQPAARRLWRRLFAWDDPEIGHDDPEIGGLH